MQFLISISTKVNIRPQSVKSMFMVDCLSKTQMRDALLIHGFRDSVPVRKLHACCYDTQKLRAKQAVLTVVFKAKAIYNRTPTFSEIVLCQGCFSENLILSFSKASKIFLALASPEYSRGPQKSFKFMVLKLLEETFVSRKIESFHFSSVPQAERNYPFHPNSVF